MRITRLKTTPVAVPYRTDEVWAFGKRSGQISVLLELETDEGIVGLGEASAYPSAEIVLAVFRSLEPLVLGEDPLTIERLIHRIDLVGTWHHIKASSPAIAAVEMACWDILGKLSGQPLVNLFGGRFRDRVEYFYYVARTDLDEVAEEGRRAAATGFGTCYIKAVHDDPRADIERVAALRDGTGPSIHLRVDANEAWSPGTAIRTIRAMEASGLELVEQPVSGRNLSEMAYVRSRIDTPLLANESSWTRHDQLSVIRSNAADAISIDNQADGGLLNLKRSAGMCEAAGLPAVKHSLGELGVALAAATHVIAATPTFRYANQAYGALLADDITSGFGGPDDNYSHGCLEVPAEPGLGVRLDEKKVERYADLYDRKAGDFSFTDEGAAMISPALPKC
ncbi:mandelate racemase/muconate lactonizing enzyme family protein [Parasphingorhabdus pacifica]